MDDFFETIALICVWAACGAFVFLWVWMSPPLHESKKADCALVEFSPDYSAEIKQLCREARSSK